MDAHLASISNWLSEVVKVLTSIATVLLVLTAVTGFLSQNWKFISHSLSYGMFLATMIFMVVVATGSASDFRRKGWH